MALDDIYKEVILDHYKPAEQAELPGAELRCHANNPCAATRSRSTLTSRVIGSRR